MCLCLCLSAAVSLSASAAAAAAFERSMRRIRNIKSIFRLFAEKMFILLSDFISFFLFLLPKNKLEYEKHRTVPGVLSLTCVWEWRLFSEQNY